MRIKFWLKKNLLLLKLAMHYRKPKRSAVMGPLAPGLRHISVISMSICVAALLVSLSMVRGYRKAILSPRLLSICGHALVATEDAEDAKILSHCPNMEAIAPYLNTSVILKGQDGNIHPIVLHGLNLDAANPASDMPRYLEGGRWSELKPGKKQIILGALIAKKLHLKCGDRVVALGGGAQKPRVNTWTVHATLNSNTPADLFYAATSLQDVAYYCPSPQPLYLCRFRHADADIAILRRYLKDHPRCVLQWEIQKYIEHMNAELRLSRRLIVIAFALLATLSWFSMASTLFMSMVSWSREIAILKSVGASPSLIKHLFILIGWIDTSIGACCGIGFGLLLNQCVPMVLQGLETLRDPTGTAALSIMFTPYCTWKDCLIIFSTLMSLVSLPLSFLSKTANRRDIIHTLS